MALLNEAVRWYQAGYMPLPLKPDWSKAPAVATWRDHQWERPDLKTVLEQFQTDSDGLGLLCGAASGHLEMIELEGRAITEGSLDKLEQALKDRELGELFDRLAAGYVELTPGGGLHFYYRVNGRANGNTRLARRPATEQELAENPDKRIKVLIETRGQGGFTVIAPSGGRSHETGRSWEVQIGTGPESIPVISEEDRDALYVIASTLDQMPVADPPPRATSDSSSQGLRPGDDFNARANWADILKGWKVVRNWGNTVGWQRPGKRHPGVSATTGRNEDDRLYVFSTSTEFEPEKPYSKFAAITLLEHGGDFAAAARALRLQGYGDSEPTGSSKSHADDWEGLSEPDAEGAHGSGPSDIKAALGALLTDLRTWQDLPDPTHVIVNLGAAATRNADGEPCWILNVAPPSSGKTEAVRILDDVADARLDEVTTAGLLGWRKGKAGYYPAGALARVGSEGALVTFGDLSSLLSTSDKGGRDQTFSTLRKAYDGHVVRDVQPPGKVADGQPDRLEWDGRLTVVGCVTGAIDRFHVHNDQLGPRWMYVRILERTTEAKRKATRQTRLRKREVEEHRARARKATAALLRSLLEQLPDLPETVADANEEAALVAAWGRGVVPRSGYGKREIEGMPVVEEPMRIVQQLDGLARGVLALGLSEGVAAAITRRVALDSMPAARHAVLKVLSEPYLAEVPLEVLTGVPGQTINTSDVARRAGLDRKVARMTLADLAAIGVVEHDRPGEEIDEWAGPVNWNLARGEEGRTIARVFRLHDANRWDEKWVY